MNKPPASLAETLSLPYRAVWTIALCTGCLAVPVAIVAPKFLWVPIILGIIAVVVFEIWECYSRGRSVQLPLQMPRNFFGLARYKGHVAISGHLDKESPGQGLFDFILSPTRRTSKAARAIRDPDTGEMIYLVDTDRFVATLLALYLPDLEKVADISLKRALHRYGEMQEMSEHLEQFLRDKTVLEVIQADFRANAAHAINRSSERAVRDLLVKLARADATAKKGS